MAFYSGAKKPTGNPGRGREYVFNRGSNRWEVMDSETGRTIGPVNQQGQLLDSSGNVRRPTAPAPQPTVRVDENQNVRPAPAPSPAPQQTVTQPAPQPVAQPVETPVEVPAAEPAPETVPVFGGPVEPDTGYEWGAAEPVAAPAPMAEPAPEPEPAGPTIEQTSAYDLIKEFLDLYGLGDLTDFVNNLVFVQDITSNAALRAEIRKTEVYQQRFAGNAARIAAGYNALDEGTYLATEDEIKKYFRNSGLPTGFYTDKETVDAIIGANISINELNERVTQGYEAVANADPEVISEMRRLYGVGDGELAAYFLDPTKARPILLRQARAATIAGEAVQAGMQIGVETAEELARADITRQQAEQGFGMISQMGELFRTNIDEQALGEQAFGQEEQIGAVFGTSAAAQQRLRQRQRRRQAQFEAGGTFATQGAEVVGLR